MYVRFAFICCTPNEVMSLVLPVAGRAERREHIEHDRMCPGFVGMRGQWSYDYGMQDY